MTQTEQYPVIEHPQPGFYETTKVRVPPAAGSKAKSRTYTHADYEAQREMTFADLDDMKDRATLYLLDKGWVPTIHGTLVDPAETWTHRTVLDAVNEAPEIVLAPPAKALAASDQTSVEGQMDLAVVADYDPADEPSALEAALAEGDIEPKEGEDRD